MFTRHRPNSTCDPELINTRARYAEGEGQSDCGIQRSGAAFQLQVMPDMFPFMDPGYSYFVVNALIRVQAALDFVLELLLGWTTR